VSTVEQAKSAGLSPCSGLIAGMGETDEDLVDVAFALRAMSPDSVPVNFLIPFDGTPLEGRWELTPQRCLRILAMVRFVNPDAEVRLAGGREIHLRTLQPLALHIVNSIFLGDYLTSEGQPGAADLAMIADAGFTVEGAEDAPGELAAALARPDLVQVRRRGAGTALPANTVLARTRRRRAGTRLLPSSLRSPYLASPRLSPAGGARSASPHSPPARSDPPPSLVPAKPVPHFTAPQSSRRRAPLARAQCCPRAPLARARGPLARARLIAGGLA
jgi:hypothetical protein